MTAFVTRAGVVITTSPAAARAVGYQPAEEPKQDKAKSEPKRTTRKGGAKAAGKN